MNEDKFGSYDEDDEPLEEYGTDDIAEVADIIYKRRRYEDKLVQYLDWLERNDR